MIERVVQNLLDNALSVTPAGGAVTVQCGPWRAAAEPGAELCYLSVTDDGPGISPGIAGRVFEKLVTTSAQGNGLGLAFCKLAIEAHGGRIWFDAVPGCGTTFYCTVPAAGSDDAAS